MPGWMSVFQIQAESNVLYVVMSKQIGAFNVGVKAISLIEVRFGPEAVKVADKTMSCCGAKGF